MWLYLNTNTPLRCRACGEDVHVGAVEVYLNADAIRSGQLAIECRCGSVFSFEDFTRLGTPLRRRANLKVPVRVSCDSARQAA